MYLSNTWDKDDRIKQTPQIHAKSLKQGFSNAQLFGTTISLRIHGF
jgi:hypothetical protein